MDSYCELKALPNPEIIESAVIAELMQTLHQLLPQFDGRIGLDFPAYNQDRTLGGIIRILGQKEDMQALRALLEGHSVVQDYALLTGLDDIPAGVERYASYQRQHVRGNSRYQRQKQRHESRGTWNEVLEQALQEKCSRPLHLPHVKLRSASTSQRFMLFIKRKSRSKPQVGSFSGYGLGIDGSTVPVFRSQ